MDNNQRILIVDDDIINLKVLSELFRQKVHVILAKSGKQAIRKAQEFDPDLILLDIRMPELDGFETLNRLRQIPENAHIPVIFISGLDDDSNEERGLKLGAADYIFKPFKPSIVLARVKTHLQLVKQTKILEQLAHSDPLTSLANRRRYDETFTKEWQFCSNENYPISLAIFDVDDFKQFNDEFGHDHGDKLLQKISQILQSCFSHPRHLVSRFGGEEFVVLMPEQTKHEASELIETCLEKIRNECEITVSAGASTYVTSTEQSSKEELFCQADEALV